jgi:hypothetical protein
MSHTLKLAALGFAFALAAGLGAAQAAPHGGNGLIVKAAQYDDDADYGRNYGYQYQRRYDYDNNGRPYGHHDDEINALQYMFPQTYGWPRGTENQF